jgi:hypothetical protein
MMWCVVRSCLCWCVWLWCFVVDCGSSEIGNLCVYVAVAVFGCGVLLFVAGVLKSRLFANPKPKITSPGSRDIEIILTNHSE